MQSAVRCTYYFNDVKLKFLYKNINLEILKYNAYNTRENIKQLFIIKIAPDKTQCNCSAGDNAGQLVIEKYERVY